MRARDACKSMAEVCEKKDKLQNDVLQELTNDHGKLVAWIVSFPTENKYWVGDSAIGTRAVEDHAGAISALSCRPSAGWRWMAVFC